MDLLSIILIAFGLSLDAFAVSVTSGVTIHNCRFKHALLIAVFFGTFQGLMPILGWMLGTSFSGYIKDFGYWIAFILLLVLGVKMIYESTKLKKAEECSNPLNFYILFLLAIATSIDAFGIGLSFACLKVTILGPALIIALITFVVSVIGVVVGDKLGHMFEGKLEMLGGIILIVIGIKILLENS